MSKEKPVVAAANSVAEELIEHAAEAARQPKAGVGKATIAANLFAVSALVASVATFVHGPTERVEHVITREDNITREAYTQLRTAIEQQGKQLIQTQQDVVGIRNFLAGYLQSQRSAVPPHRLNVMHAQRPSSTARAGAGQLDQLLPPAREPEPEAEPLADYEAVRAQADKAKH